MGREERRKVKTGHGEKGRRGEGNERVNMGREGRRKVKTGHGEEGRETGRKRKKKT